MSTKPNIEISVLCVGLEESTFSVLADKLSMCKITKLPYDFEKLMEQLDPPPHLIICGPPDDSGLIVEAAQSLSMQYQGVPLYYVSFKRDNYDRKTFVKNGFTDAFLLPIDTDVLKRNMSDYFAQISNGQIKSYRSVKLIDIEPGTVLNFDTTIYLPANHKYIKYAAAGDEIEEAKIKKLKSHNMSSVYVPSNQMQQFYQYTAGRLQNINSSNKMSETEKREKMGSSVRNLVSGLFNDTDKESTFEQGQNFLKDSKEIINNFIAVSPGADWYQNLVNTMGEMSSSYCHAGNVSTYASLFSIGLGIGKPEELAIAGLFHDIGLADVPAEIVAKKEEERTKEGQELYKKHPEYSIEILKRKKMILPEIVVKAILQHHENFNGTGYPKGLVGSRICKEAQILALADRFDYLTSAVEGQPLMTPEEAVEFFKKQMIGDPNKMIFDPELLKNVLKLFPDKTQESKT